MNKLGDVQLRSIQVRIALILIAIVFVLKGAPAIRTLVAREIMDDLALTKSTFGILFTITSATTGLTQIPVGMFIDRFGMRRVAGVVFCFLALCFGTAFIYQPIFSHVALAIGLGLAAALLMPLTLKALSEWYSVRVHGRVLCILLGIGGVVVSLLTIPIGLVSVFLHWTYAFGVFVPVILLCLIGIFFLLRDRRDIPLHDEQELSLDVGMPYEQAPSSIFKGFFRMMGYASTWGIFTGSVAISMLSEAQQTWVSMWLLSGAPFKVGSMNLAEFMGAISVCGFLGWVGCACLFDWVAKRSDPFGARRMLVVIGLVAAALLWTLARYAPNLVGFMILAGAADFFTSFVHMSLLLISISIIPSRYCATFVAIQAFGAILGRFVSTVLLGVFGGDDWFYMSGSLTIGVSVALIAAPLFLWWVRKPVIGTETRGIQSVFA